MQVTKAEFRRAQCRGLLASCEVVWHAKGRAWMKDGKPLAIEKEGTFGTTYYLETAQ